MNQRKNITKHSGKNPWKPEDEGDHYPSIREWWCTETIFKTVKDNKKYHFKGSFAYELETPSCFIIYKLFDYDKNRFLINKEDNDDVDKLKFVKNKVDVRYEKSRMYGQYPNYNIHIEDEKLDFEIDLDLKAKVLPHWSAQDSSNGYLPIGIGYFRYGWLINNDLTGYLIHEGKKQQIVGKGYFERAWGNFLYSNPFKKLSDLRKTFSTYANLCFWFLSGKKPGIPNRIVLTTENNPFGYDWFWSVFDNDWSIFFGNLLFWFCEGPGFGMLTVCDEKGNYIEFRNINIKYNKVKYIKRYDMIYPTDLSVSGSSGDKKINIHVSSISNTAEYIDDFKSDNFYKAFILTEFVGHITGVYKDNEKVLKLDGDCKFESQRQPSVLGHNQLAINIIKPPTGVGVELDLDSHYLKKKLFTRIKLAPKPDLKFKISSRKK